MKLLMKVLIKLLSNLLFEHTVRTGAWHETTGVVKALHLTPRIIWAVTSVLVPRPTSFFTSAKKKRGRSGYENRLPPLHCLRYYVQLATSRMLSFTVSWHYSIVLRPLYLMYKYLHCYPEI